MSPIVLCDKETGHIKTFKTKSSLELSSLMTMKTKSGSWRWEVAKIKGKIVDSEGVVFECSIPYDFTAKKAVKYTQDWYFWKTSKKSFAYISVLQWDYERKDWIELANKHGGKV